LSSIPLSTLTTGCQLFAWNGSAFIDWTVGEHWIAFHVDAIQ
jgi:hypothetical protein